jgi:O-antigen/teichoic acid export membrane protein
VGTALYVRFVHEGSILTLSTIGDLPGALLFFVLSSGAAIAVLVDARMMTARRWKWVFGRLVATGALRIPLLLIPSPIDSALWLFVAIAAPISLSGFVGLIVLRRTEGYRPAVRPIPESAPQASRFALVSYVSQLSLFAAQFALPVIVLVSVSASDNANFFVAWTIASVAFILPVTIGRVLLAEGSRADLVLDHSAVVGLRLGTALMLAASVGALVLRPLMVALYRSDYRLAASILPTLVLGGIPWAVTTIALGRARVLHDHVGTVVMTLTLAVAVIGSALVSVPNDGVHGAVRSWVLGTTISAAVAIALSLRRVRTDG